MKVKKLIPLSKTSTTAMEVTLTIHGNKDYISKRFGEDLLKAIDLIDNNLKSDLLIEINNVTMEKETVSQLIDSSKQLLWNAKIIKDVGDIKSAFKI